MAKEDKNIEPMLEESSDEILLEETSGVETFLEESLDKTLLKESQDEDKDKAKIIEEADAKTSLKAETSLREEAEKPQQKKSDEDFRKGVVDNIIANMVGGFEIIHVFSKNEPYKVCKYPVTQYEWEAIMGDNPSWEKNPQFPVTNVTYYEAQTFIARVNKYAEEKGVQFILPTEEMQWLGYQKKFAEAYKGKDSAIASDYCCFEKKHLQPVGQLKSSAGIYDACGLVYELCQMKKSETLHYGAFDQPWKFCESAYKMLDVHADQRYNNVGFRLVCIDNILKVIRSIL